MFDNLHIIDTLRNAGFEAGEITVTETPGVREITITGANADNILIDVATDAARSLATAGYDILCYGTGLGAVSCLATLMVQLPAAGARAA